MQHNCKLRPDAGSSRLGKKDRERNNKDKDKRRLNLNANKKKKDEERITKEKRETRLRSHQRQWKREAAPLHYSQTANNQWDDTDFTTIDWGDEYDACHMDYEWKAGPCRFFLQNEVYRKYDDDDTLYPLLDDEQKAALSLSPYWSFYCKRDEYEALSEDAVKNTIFRLGSKDVIAAGMLSAGERDFRHTIVGLSKLCNLGHAHPKEYGGLFPSLVSLPEIIQMHILSTTNHACCCDGPLTPGVYVCTTFFQWRMERIDMILILYPGLQRARMLSHDYERTDKLLSEEDLITLVLDPNLPMWEATRNGQMINVATPMGVFSGQAVWHVENATTAGMDLGDGGLQEDHTIGVNTFVDTEREHSPKKEKGSCAIHSIGWDNVRDKRLYHRKIPYSRFGLSDNWNQDSLFELVLPL